MGYAKLDYTYKKEYSGIGGDEDKSGISQSSFFITPQPAGLITLPTAEEVFETEKNGVNLIYDAEDDASFRRGKLIDTKTDKEIAFENNQVVLSAGTYTISYDFSYLYVVPGASYTD